MNRRDLLLATLVAGIWLGGCGPASLPAGVAGSASPLVAEPAAMPVAGSGGVNRAEHLDKPYVVIVSFDGFRHDYLDRIDAPNFRRVQERGVRADGLVPVFPTKTFPNHYSIATGQYAEEHGLVDNNFYDPELDAIYRMRDTAAVRDGRWYGGEPIWVTAERQGMVAGTFFFVGSEAPVGGVRPSHWRAYDGRVANSTRVRQVLEWMALPPARRPHLVMLYFSDVDAAGHRFGPDSEEVAEAVRRVDRALGELLDGIAGLPFADEVNLIVVSDHGMIGVDSTRVEYLDDLVELRGVRAAATGAYATLWVGDSVRADAIRDRLNEGLRAARAYRRYEIPERFRYRGSARVGDLLVLAEPGHQVQRRGSQPLVGGTHGYDPAVSEMRGIFLAQGPAFRVGARVPAFESVNVYPLVAHLLGLEPSPSHSGRLEAVRSILREAR